MEGEDGKFEYQISTDDTKSWFDSVRACKVNHSPVPTLLFSSKVEIQIAVMVRD